MVGARKSLFRFAILILFIPVGLLLVLHFFGENRMEVPVLRSMEECAVQAGSVKVLLSGADFTNQERNQLQRIARTLNKKRMELDARPMECLGDTIAILMVDAQNQLRGAYKLEQAEINRLFTELDILLMNESYGEGVSR